MDYEYLAFLRKNTYLSIREKIKVQKLREDAIVYQCTMNRLENCMLGADFSKADNLEYQFRFKRFAEDLIPDWADHGDGLSLEAFAEKVIRDNKDKKRILRR